MAELKPVEQKLMDTVDSLADDMLDFAVRLTAQPSTLGNEEGALIAMSDELNRLGYSPRRIPMDSEELLNHTGYAPTPWIIGERYNLASVRPADGDGGKSALFNGHLDVVSPEPLEFWEREPFEPVVENGRLYGRGAGDMKAGVAAMTYAVRAVDVAALGLNAPVTINAVIEEECSGNGALASVIAGYDADAILIPEPFGPVLNTTQVGVLWFRVDVSGVATHVLATEAGTNAIDKCYLLMQKLRELEDELNREGRPEKYRDLIHPLNLNIGIIQGGDWPSTVPAQTSFHGRLSYFPGTGFDEIRKRIEECIHRAAMEDLWLKENPPKIHFYGFRSDGHSIEPNQPVPQTLSDCHRDLSGLTAAEYISTCTTDMRAFHFFGKGQATCFGPVAENIHGANESVDIESIRHTAKAYALFLSRWCGVIE